MPKRKKPKKPFKAQINQIPKIPETYSVLEYMCRESNNLFNCSTYYARQVWFKAFRYAHKFELTAVMKDNRHFSAMCAQAAQQTCLSVGEAFSSFAELRQMWKNGELQDKPKPPNYRESGGLFQVSYPKAAIKLVDGMVRLPLGKLSKAWFGLQYVFIPFPSNLDWKRVREVQVIPRAGYFDSVFICTGDIVEQPKLDPAKWLSLDPGVDNWLTGFSNAAPSFIIDGRHIKSLNQWYNKRVATIKEDKPQAFWCRLLERTTEKRNRQMRDAVNKAARMVVNYCIENEISTIVFGWNKGQKKRSNMGRKNNQKFVQIPTARLMKRVQQIAEPLGMIFIEQEESYTSKADALANDTIPVYGEKPATWKASGKRTHRGLYRSSVGITVNADCNAAYNIGRKAGMQVGGFLTESALVGYLTSPERLTIWNKVGTCPNIIRPA